MVQAEAMRAIGAVVEAHAAVHAREVRSGVAAIAAVVRDAAPALEARRAMLHAELRDAVEHRHRRGQPPPVFTIIGRQRDELPLNRLLAWILNPEERHGLGRRPVRALARSLAFAELVEDIDGDGPVKVRGEEAWPEVADSGDAPDLLVLTARCALLIENKVWSPQSGPRQYADYREALDRLVVATGRAHARAVLAARRRRARPDGWDDVRTHGELARIFTSAAREMETDEPGHWGAVTARLVAHALRGEPDVGAALAEASELLYRLARLLPRELSRAERLLAILTEREEA